MYQQIAQNKRRTFVLMFAFLLILFGLSEAIGLVFKLPDLVFIIGVAAVIYAVISYFRGSNWALAVNGAKEIQKSDDPRLWRIVENLAITDGLPMPKVYIMPDPSPNAFATGRDPDHSIVCATSGLLQIMNDTELEGVIAHELGHVKNYDIRVNMLAFALVGVIAIVADIFLRISFWGGDDDERGGNNLLIIVAIVAAIIAPIAASLIQLAISRRREYLADATGALTTRYPEGLASALEKIEKTGSVMKKQNTATAHMFFANPLKKGSIANLFDTHPPIEKRIQILREMNL